MDKIPDVMGYMQLWTSPAIFEDLKFHTTPSMRAAVAGSGEDSSGCSHAEDGGGMKRIKQKASLPALISPGKCDE